MYFKAEKKNSKVTEDDLKSAEKDIQNITDKYISDIEKLVEAKEKESGATVHFVTSGIDEGEAILQKSFEITEDDTPETVAEKVHLIEYEIYPIAINKVLNNIQR